jgi:hypothetical protein
MNGNNVAAQNIYLGLGSGQQQPVTVNRGTTPGSISAFNLDLDACSFSLMPADNISNFLLSSASTTLMPNVSVFVLGVNQNSSASATDNFVIEQKLNLSIGSTVTVTETTGTGLTLDGNTAGDLSIDSTSHLNLGLAGTNGWDFRWQDPSNGNWISTLNGLIAGGKIDISGAPGGVYSVYDQGGFTYIGTVPVPEPAGLTVFAFTAVAMRRRPPMLRREPRQKIRRLQR